jgi:homoisocitrate dehydrogenase
MPATTERSAAALRILVIPGDGIGREVMPAAVEVLRATGLPLQFVEAEAGWGCFERSGVSLPPETLAAARAADAILFGAVASPSHPVVGYRSPIVALRRELDLYANIRPVRPLRDGSLGQRHPPIDLVVVRENTEGLYVGLETSDGETAIAQRVITRRASERIARVAFELARSRKTRNEERGTRNITLSSSLIVPRSSFPKVTIVHKANILRETCGLFRTTALQVAAEYPDVAVDELLVDTAALQLVQQPERFDVIVTTNLFGDILSDVASVWSGGLGMAPSANIGARHALFEPVHGAAPDIAGRGIANPLAAIGCAAMLLEYLADRRLAGADLPMGTAARAEAGSRSLAEQCRSWAGRMHDAIRATLADGVATPDLGGSASTQEVTQTVITAMRR